MAANDLVVRISARDTASPVLQKLGRNLRGTGASIKGVERNFAGLNRETKGLRDFSRGLVVPRLVQGIKGIAREGENAFRSVGKLGIAVRALGGVEGLGIGSLIGGSIVAARHWSTLGTNTRNVANNIGITVGQLRRFQDVSKLVNVSPQATDSALYGIANSLQGLKVNNSPIVNASLKELGVQAYDAHGRLLPLARVIPQISDAIARIPNGPRQTWIADTLHAEGLLPVFRKGGQWLNRNMAAFKTEGETSGLFEGSRKLNADFAKLDIQTDVLAHRFERKLAPAVDDAVVGLTHFIRDLGGYLTPKLLPNVKPTLIQPWERHLVRKFVGTPRGIRDNNPLNLKYVAGQKGLVGRDGQFGRYGSMRAGIAAGARQLQLDNARGLNTVRNIVNSWDSGDPGNIRFAYAHAVARWMHVSPDARLDLNNPRVMSSLIQAMGRFETGREIPLPSVRAGVAAANGHVTVDINHNGAPPGVSSRASVTGDGNVILGTIRINRAPAGEALP